MLKDSTDRFSIANHENCTRLRRIETKWAEGKPTNNIDTAFWKACYERAQRPAEFTARDQYLKFGNRVEWGVRMVKGEEAKSIYDDLRRRHLQLSTSQQAVSSPPTPHSLT
jgi:hypothetical protein